MVGIFFNFNPNENPNRESKNVIIPIKAIGFRILFPYKESEIPAEKASILVATPIRNRHAKLIEDGVSFFENASFINFNPKNVNITNTIIGANGSI